MKAEMKGHTAFNYYSFSKDVLDLFEETRATEMHDKIMVSTAKLLKAETLITKDRELRKLGEVKTLW